ncbi:creatinine amidohydrolase [Paenibacillus darwinianus]|uniref:Creatinine amidohydrolase n=1 Tax=Paenibacillus darwinianus TaxID=1380763 RepID=A0A9W5W6L1_9BACL|nr:creatininase family protein [Paenibacillus darwinianus]EXX87010.1 creatinine amidohydrolase [Paenibacillus darwinianus]EXX87147.1 creatinine amidohydrolase [Paenibacillus darwinianus]EXX87294.1 creatinine amidohydrolase [Paenibacillus darwinianus]
MPSSYLLTQMTWPEVEQALKTVKIAIIPLGAHEQHGPHMVESCDAVLAEEMGKRLAERLYPEALVTPVINMGISPHHIHFPGTISLEPATLIAILRDMIVSLKHHGIRHVLVLNAHGGNQATLGVASDMLTRELEVNFYYAKTTASAKDVMDRRIESKLYGHSCDREVSEALYLASHLVRADKLEKGDIQEGKWRKLRPGNPLQGYYYYEEMTRNGCIGDATKASREIGEEIVETALDRLARAVKDVL